jgi:hypothetical protein
MLRDAVLLIKPIQSDNVLQLMQSYEFIHRVLSVLFSHFVLVSQVHLNRVDYRNL